MSKPLSERITFPSTCKQKVPFSSIPFADKSQPWTPLTFRVRRFQVKSPDVQTDHASMNTLRSQPLPHLRLLPALLCPGEAWALEPAAPQKRLWGALWAHSHRLLTSRRHTQARKHWRLPNWWWWGWGLTLRTSLHIFNHRMWQNISWRDFKSESDSSWDWSPTLALRADKIFV